MLRDSFTYAVRSLFKRRLRSWLTVIGIFIGIAAVVALISLGSGLRDAVIGQFGSIGADRISIQAKGAGFGPPGLGSAVKLTQDDLEVVKRSSHVKSAAGRLIYPVNMEYKGVTTIAFTASLPEARDERQVVERFLNPKLEMGRWLEADDQGSVVLGHAIAHSERLKENITVGQRITLEGRRFQVIGILEKKGIPASDIAIIINEQDARDVLGRPDEYSVIVAQAETIEETELAKEAIIRDLQRHRGVKEREEDFEVQTSQDILNTVDTILSIVTGVLAGIAGISILVGGIGIMNTMYTAVIERTREIGIMKAIGATNEQILILFLIESGLLGMVGASIGVLVGIGLSQLVELAARFALGPSVLQALTPPWLIIGSLTFGFIIGTLSGTLPAKRAASLPPVEALR